MQAAAISAEPSEVQSMPHLYHLPSAGQYSDRRQPTAPLARGGSPSRAPAGVPRPLSGKACCASCAGCAAGRTPPTSGSGVGLMMPAARGKGYRATSSALDS